MNINIKIKDYTRMTLEQLNKLCIEEGNKLIELIDKNAPIESIKYQKAMYDIVNAEYRYKQRIKYSI